MYCNPRWDWQYHRMLDAKTIVQEIRNPALEEVIGRLTTRLDQGIVAKGVWDFNEWESGVDEIQTS